ncbi:hypothetical protein [Fischerella sp. JS2]|uniref:hypothetical protein n=1 Tax=Fischerella sp. JS2 TaxID=2597771 RepID=UPI0028EE22F8|nr:hypothetical protein [Fischerella sp. JS2]
MIPPRVEESRFIRGVNPKSSECFYQQQAITQNTGNTRKINKSGFSLVGHCDFV